MNTHSDKTQENKRQLFSGAGSQVQSDGESAFQFVDNRHETVAQRKFQEIANNSPQTKQLAQLQAKVDNYSAQQQQPIQKKENNTGLPDDLKSGVENLSGYSMDDVNVHYNSSKPAQLQAQAYAQGTDIHIAPGQEKHLSHEAWHVVQQKRGRVKPTMQMKGEINVNDDDALEKEADEMGEKATQLKNDFAFSNKSIATINSTSSSVQLKPILANDDDKNYPFKDDKNAYVRLKEVKEEESTYEIKLDNGTKKVWYKLEGDKYYEDEGFTIEFELNSIGKERFKEFKDFHMLHHQVEEHNEKEGVSIEVKNALKMYVLQRFMSNALYSTEEIANLEYQTTPLNYQANGNYIRSKATAFVLALKKILAKEKDSEELYLVKNTNFDGVLAEFFYTVDQNAVTGEGLGKGDLSSQIEKITTYYLDKGDLKGYDDITFINVKSSESSLEKVQAELKKAANEKLKVISKSITERILSKRYAIQEGDKDKLESFQKNMDGDDSDFEKVIGGRYDTIDEKKDEKVDELKDSAKKTKANHALYKNLQAKLGEDGNQKIKYDELSIDELGLLLQNHPDKDSGKFNLGGKGRYLPDAIKQIKEEEEKKILIFENYKNSICKEVDKIDLGDGNDISKSKLMYDGIKSEIGKYTTEEFLNKAEIVSHIKDFETKQEDEIDKEHKKQYVDFVKDRFTNVSLGEKEDKQLTKELENAVFFGSSFTMEDEGKNIKQPGFLVDHNIKSHGTPKIEWALNKSGYVPNPTAVSRQMIELEPKLTKIIANIIAEQTKFSGKEAKAKIESFASGLESVIWTEVKVDSLKDKVKSALDDFKRELITSEEIKDNIKKQAEAAYNLIDGLKILEDDQFPELGLQSLFTNLGEAIKNKDKIEKYIRNIQNLHEVAILKLAIDDNQETNVSDSLKALVGSEETEKASDKAQSIHYTDYGLKAFSHAFTAVLKQFEETNKGVEKPTMEIHAYSNIYFELLDKFGQVNSSKKKLDDTAKVTLSKPKDFDEYKDYPKENNQAHPDVVIIDIHPNDASKSVMNKQEVVEVIKEIFVGDEAKAKRVTVMVDITLNHIEEDEVKDLKKEVAEYIDSGQLNLVFLQSLTKFAQLGMDKQSGGLMYHFNKEDQWEKFNESIKDSEKDDKPDPLVAAYFNALFDHASKEQIAYLKLIRENTKHVYKDLENKFKVVKGFYQAQMEAASQVGDKKKDVESSSSEGKMPETANRDGYETEGKDFLQKSKKIEPSDIIKLSVSEDPGTCYVAFEYTEATARLYAGNKDRYDESEKLAHDILNDAIYNMMKEAKVPLSMRQSFGFPVSNLGEAWIGSRFTIGTESHELLDQYVDIITLAKAKLEELSDEELKSKSRRDIFKKFSENIESIKDVRKELRKYGFIEMFNSQGDLV